jgi:hypothetical protein
MPPEFVIVISTFYILEAPKANDKAQPKKRV